MRLFLIRHGQTDSNVKRLLDTARPGAPLNDLGHAQAEALVEKFRHVPLQALYASTLTRTQQTAAPLAKDRGLDVKIIDDLREISAGVEEMSADWTVYMRALSAWSPDNMDEGVEGGETLRQFLTRYFRAIEEIESDGHEVAALFSHGAALRVFGLMVAPHLTDEGAPLLRNTDWIEIEGSTSDGWQMISWAGINHA